jgi:type II secretory pathway predicted ATPase ExeA
MSPQEPGLKDQPFRMIPDLDFYVDSGPHRSAVAALRQGLARGESFMALTGDAGVGKTTALRRLLSEVDRARHQVAEIGWPGLDADDLPHRVAQGFGLQVPDGADAVAALRRFIEQLGRDRRFAFLAMDEAQGLPVDSLRQLLQLTRVQVGTMRPLQVLLVGHHLPPSVRLLQDQGEALAMGTEVHLQALGPAETRDYVLQRMARAGWSGRPVMLEDATERIHGLSGGVPRRINLLANRVIHEAGLQDSIEVNATFVQAVEDLRNIELGGLGLGHAVAVPEHAVMPPGLNGAPPVLGESAVLSRADLLRPVTQRAAVQAEPWHIASHMPGQAGRRAAGANWAWLASLMLVAVLGLGWWQRSTMAPPVPTLPPPGAALERMVTPAGPADVPPAAAKAEAMPSAGLVTLPGPRSALAGLSTVPDEPSAAPPAVRAAERGRPVKTRAERSRVTRAATPAVARGSRAVPAQPAQAVVIPGSSAALRAPAAVAATLPAMPTAAAPCSAAAASMGLCGRPPAAEPDRERAAAAPCDAGRAALGLCPAR